MASHRCRCANMSCCILDSFHHSSDSLKIFIGVHKTLELPSMKHFTCYDCLYLSHKNISLHVKLTLNLHTPKLMLKNQT